MYPVKLEKGPLFGWSPPVEAITGSSLPGARKGIFDNLRLRPFQACPHSTLTPTLPSPAAPSPAPRYFVEQACLKKYNVSNNPPAGNEFLNALKKGKGKTAKSKCSRI